MTAGQRPSAHSAGWRLRSAASRRPKRRLDWHHRTRFEAWSMFVFLFVLYTAGSAGIVCSNDGSHYALVRSLGDWGSCCIDRYVHYTGFLDVAQFRGHWFSDRPPGTAVLALPFYLAGKSAAALKFGHHITLPITAVLLMPAACGALTALLCTQLSVQLGANRRAAVFGALLLALGTTNWRYATALFHHAPSACLVAAAYVLALRQTPRFLWSGLCAGSAIVVDYSNALFGPWLVLLAITAGPSRWRGTVRFIAGCLPPLALLAGYHWLCFGSPLATSYTHHYRFVWSTTVAGALRETWWKQLGNVTWRPPGGLLAMSPVLVLAPAGWLRITRHNWKHGVALAGGFLSLLIVVSSHRTPFGGGTIDARYLSAGLPLAVAAIAVAARNALGCGRRGFPHPVALVMLGLLVGLSILAQVVAVATFFGHELHELPSELVSHRLGGTAEATAWSTLALSALRALFPGVCRIPAALPLAVLCLAGVVVHARFRSHRGGQLPEPGDAA